MYVCEHAKGGGGGGVDGEGYVMQIRLGTFVIFRVQRRFEPHTCICILDEFSAL